MWEAAAAGGRSYSCVHCFFQMDFESRGSYPNNSDRKGDGLGFFNCLNAFGPSSQLPNDSFFVLLPLNLPAALFSCKVVDDLAGTYLGKTRSGNNLQILRNFEGKHF